MAEGLTYEQMQEKYGIEPGPKKKKKKKKAKKAPVGSVDNPRNMYEERKKKVDDYLNNI